MRISFDNSYARLSERFYARVEPTPVSRPSLLQLNRGLAERLGLCPDELESTEGVEALAGNRALPGSEPIALAYAGHQFGGFVPRLGDGRAVLLGEVVGADGQRRDIQLKGAGRTPFSRGGDGRAAVGPVLREYLVSESMAALGVPTTRALAAVATGDPVYRERPLPGAVLTRVASSHLRVGTFQYFAAREDTESLTQLVDYALARHYPELSDEPSPALALLGGVMAAQAHLVARWLGVGFVHGVMNTDNTSIAGETIDYGPCAFLDAYDPGRTFSSIDHNGRYAFGNQPRIALWNLARLAEALLPLIDTNEEKAIREATEALDAFVPAFEREHGAVLRQKLGFHESRDGDLDHAKGWLDLLAQDRVDYTWAHRQLAHLVADPAKEDALCARFASGDQLRRWLEGWRARLEDEPTSAEARLASMKSANPAFIPRNHRVEEALEAAMAGDLAPFERLLAACRRPFEDQPEAAELAEPPGADQWSYKTFCGT